MPLALYPWQVIKSALWGLPREPEPAPDPHMISSLTPDLRRWEYFGPFPSKRAAELFRAAELGTRSAEIAPLIDPSRWRA